MGKIELANRHEAARIVRSFLPLFKRLDEEGVDYCIVGGLAVMIQTMRHAGSSFRVTNDADIMFSKEYTNKDFAADYLTVFAGDPAYGEAVYEALFGDAGFDVFGEDEANLENVSFVGASAEIDGIDTPDFDVVRRLNAKTIETIHYDRVRIDGVPVNVACLDDLADMKRQTIELLHAPITETPRPQDWADLKNIEELLQTYAALAEAGLELSDELDLDDDEFER